MTDFDAVVVGGGPAGAGAAQLLACRGWRVAVLENKAFPRPKVCGEYLSATNIELLERMGIRDAFDAEAGPPVTDVGFFSGTTRLSAPLPRATPLGWGRALSRERLDSLLLERAARAGAVIYQPYLATGLRRDADAWLCLAKRRTDGVLLRLRAPVVIAAHGSWERHAFPTQQAPASQRGSDLFGFKAHFRSSALATGLMPLLAFAGGYGGMVATDQGRVSLSCCVRRDCLASLARSAGKGTGDLVFQYVSDQCAGVRAALAGARRDGDWLAAGPLRTGVHLRAPTGVFRVGNAAGEAHPVVAEGITMALQAAWLLVELLNRWREAGAAQDRLGAVGAAYEAAWRRSFGGRVRAAAAIAHWAMRPGAVGLSLPVLRRFPQLLTWGARWSGKTQRVGSRRL